MLIACNHWHLTKSQVTEREADDTSVRYVPDHLYNYIDEAGGVDLIVCRPPPPQHTQININRQTGYCGRPIASCAIILLLPERKKNSYMLDSLTFKSDVLYTPVLIVRTLLLFSHFPCSISLILKIPPGI